jgi:hypothetical protein
LQLALLLRPQLGPVIRGSGGIRKFRWSVKGKGKRGGIRVIYFWHEASETFMALFLMLPLAISGTSRAKRSARNPMSSAM